jgi:hypothetical protein
MDFSQPLVMTSPKISHTKRSLLASKVHWMSTESQETGLNSFFFFFHMHLTQTWISIFTAEVDGVGQIFRKWDFLPQQVLYICKSIWLISCTKLTSIYIQVKIQAKLTSVRVPATSHLVPFIYLYLLSSFYPFTAITSGCTLLFKQ